MSLQPPSPMMVGPPPPPPPGPPPRTPRRSRSRSASPRHANMSPAHAAPPPPRSGSPAPGTNRRDIVAERRRAAMAMYESEEMVHDRENESPNAAKVSQPRREHLRSMDETRGGSRTPSPRLDDESERRASFEEYTVFESSQASSPELCDTRRASVDAFIYELTQPDLDDDVDLLELHRAASSGSSSGDWVHPALSEVDAIRSANATPTHSVVRDSSNDWSHNPADSDGSRIRNSFSSEADTFRRVRNSSFASTTHSSSHSDAETVLRSNQAAAKLTSQISNRKSKKKKQKGGSSSSPSGSSKRGFFKKILGRSKDKGSSSSPASTPRRSRKPSSNSLGRAHDLKPGQSYKSTPNSAEILIRQQNHPADEETVVRKPKLRVDTGASNDLQFVREEFSPPRFTNDLVSPNSTSSKTFVFQGQMYEAPEIVISQDEVSEITDPSVLSRKSPLPGALRQGAEQARKSPTVSPVMEQPSSPALERPRSPFVFQPTSPIVEQLSAPVPPPPPPPPPPPAPPLSQRSQPQENYLKEGVSRSPVHEAVLGAKDFPVDIVDDDSDDSSAPDPAMFIDHESDDDLSVPNPADDIVNIDDDSLSTEGEPPSLRRHVKGNEASHDASMQTNSSLEEEEVHVGSPRKKIEISFKPNSIKEKIEPSFDSDHMTAPMTIDSSFSSSVDDEAKASQDSRQSTGRKSAAPSPEKLLKVPKPQPPRKETESKPISSMYLSRYKSLKARKLGSEEEENVKSAPSEKSGMSGKSVPAANSAPTAKRASSPKSIPSARGASSPKRTSSPPTKRATSPIPFPSQRSFLSSRVEKKGTAATLAKAPTRFRIQPRPVKVDDDARRRKEDAFRLKLEAMEVEARIKEEEAARAREKAVFMARQREKESARAKAEAARIAARMKEHRVQQIKEEAMQLEARKRVEAARAEARALRERTRPRLGSWGTRPAPLQPLLPQWVDEYSVAYGLSLKARNKLTLDSTPKARVISPEEKRVLELSRRNSSYSMINQEEITDPIQLAGVRLLSKSAIPIQTGIRRFLAKKEAVDRMWALVEIQCCFRRWKCEAFKLANVFAATKIQAAVRGSVARASFTLIVAALRIQTGFRAMLARVVFASLIACLRIQATFRGSLVRGQLNDMRTKIQRIQSVIRLQSLIRGFLARVSVDRAFAAISIQAVYRGWIMRQDLKQKKSACKIQAAFRGWATRDSIDEQHFCAREIQRMLRGYLLRLWLKRERSVIIIQASWRSYATHLRYQFDVVDIIIVQSLCRRRLAKNKAIQIRQEILLRVQQEIVRRNNDAATMIQSNFRQYSARMNFLYSLYHVILAQTVVRRRLALNVANLKFAQRDAVPKIQRAWRIYNVTKGRRWDAAATSIQKTWRRFFQCTHYIIKRYECVRIQTVYRGYLAKNESDMRLGCVIILQTVVRGFLTRRKYGDAVIFRLMVKASVLSRSETMACSQIQAWWRGKVMKKKKAAAMVIIRFFVMVKYEVDREVRRHERRRRRRRGGNRDAEGRNYRERKGCMSRVLGQDSDPPGLRAKDAIQKNKERARGRSKSNPRPRKLQHDTGGVRKRSKSTPRDRGRKHVIHEPPRSNRYERRPTDAVTVSEFDEMSELSGITSPSVNYGRPRFETYSPKQLADDLSLEEAWIDAGVHQMKEKRRAEEQYMHGLRKSKSAYERVMPRRSSPRGGRYFFSDHSLHGDSTYMAERRAVYHTNPKSPRDATYVKIVSPRNHHHHNEPSSRRRRSDAVQYVSPRDRVIVKSRSSGRESPRPSYRHYYEHRRAHHDYGREGHY